MLSVSYARVEPKSRLGRQPSAIRPEIQRQVYPTPSCFLQLLSLNEQLIFFICNKVTVRGQNKVEPRVERLRRFVRSKAKTKPHPFGTNCRKGGAPVAGDRIFRS